MMAMTHLSSILEAGTAVKGQAAGVGVSTTYMDPEVVGTMGMSSASMGMDQGMWNCGANSLITRFLKGQILGLYWNRSTGRGGGRRGLTSTYPRTLAQSS